MKGAVWQADPLFVFLPRVVCHGESITACKGMVCRRVRSHRFPIKASAYLISETALFCARRKIKGPGWRLENLEDDWFGRFLRNEKRDRYSVCASDFCSVTIIYNNQVDFNKVMNFDTTAFLGGRGGWGYFLIWRRLKHCSHNDLQIFKVTICILPNLCLMFVNTHVLFYNYCIWSDF